MLISPMTARWRPSTPFRVPLQTGDGFNMALVLVGLVTVPGWVSGIAGLILLATGHWILGPAFMLLGAFFVAAFWLSHRELSISRVSDFEADADGFVVRGGHFDGAGLKWDELDVTKTKLSKVKESTGLAKQLVVASKSGATQVIAEGEEADSFRAVLRLLVGTTQREEEEPQEKPRDVELILCSECRAPLQPVEAEKTVCGHCSASVEVPAQFRELVHSIREGSKLKEKTSRTLEALLDSPRQRIVGPVLVLLAALIVVDWGFGLVWFVHALRAGTVDVLPVLAMILSPLFMMVALALVGALAASRRVAVRTVSLDFGAIAPLKPGEPFGCRGCAAPLPDAGAALTVRCVYCQADNVLRMARPRLPAKVKKEAAKLEDALDMRSSEQLTRLIFLVVVGVPAFLLGLKLQTYLLAHW